MKPCLDGGNGRGGSRVTRVSTDKRYLSNPCLVSWARVEALNPLTKRVDLIHLFSSKSLSFLLALQAASGLHFGHCAQCRVCYPYGHVGDMVWIVL